MRWKSMFDVKVPFFQMNSKYTYDRQTIKYMGNELPNKYIIFEQMNSKNYLTFDIIIEKLILEDIVNEKIFVDEIWHNVSSLIEKKCWIIHLSRVNSCNETAIIKHFYSYGDDIFLLTKKILKG